MTPNGTLHSIPSLAAKIREYERKRMGRWLLTEKGEKRLWYELYQAHNCLQPFGWELWARDAPNTAEKPIGIRGFARCRKCENCRRAKSSMWEFRAENEYQRSKRSMFGTLTIRPEEHERRDFLLIERLGIRQYRDLTPAELFAARASAFGGDITLWLKRLRKGQPDRKPSFRYMVVAEAHDSASTSVEMRGRPHFHILLHEQTEDALLVKGSPGEAFLEGEAGEWVKKKYKTRGDWREGVFAHDTAWIRQQWEFGFTKFQYAENAKAASYLCKYISKTVELRVRASLEYGKFDLPSAIPAGDALGSAEPQEAK